MWTIELPLRVTIGSDKKFILNLNHYRNANFWDLDKAKKRFTELVRPRIKHLPHMDRVNITYTYFAPSKRLADTNNICSIVDKFFADTLVNAHKLTDDNHNFLLDTTFRFGGVDRGNPRVEATIELAGSVGIQPAENPLSVPLKENNLKITIVQTEIEEAIRNHITGQITVKDGMRIDIELRATRGDEGFIANIDISPDTNAKTPVEKPAVVITQADATIEVVKPEPAKEVAKPVTTKPKTTSLFGAAKPVAPAPAPTPEPIVQEVAEVEPETAVQPVVEAMDEVIVEGELIAEQVDAKPEPETDDKDLGGEGGAPLKPSIFANLRRPNNAVPETADA